MKREMGAGELKCSKSKMEGRELKCSNFGKKMIGKKVVENDGNFTTRGKKR